MSNSGIPRVTVTLSIEPPSFTPGAECNIHVSAINQSSVPITIGTWPTIFNLSLAQERRNFFCTDLDTNTPIDLEITKGPKRSGFFNFELGGKDDAYFHTLEPGQPTVFKSRFFLAYRAKSRPEDIKPGHHFQFGVREGEQIGKWWTGRKEDIMSPRGQRQACPASEGPPILLSNIQPVEFEIKAE